MSINVKGSDNAVLVVVLVVTVVRRDARASLTQSVIMQWEPKAIGAKGYLTEAT